MNFYRVYYTQEIANTAVVYGSVDLTEDHVETIHGGNVVTAILDSGTDLTWRTVTSWEKLSA